MAINIVYSLNDKYAFGAGCSIKSLCSNTHSTEDIIIYILFSELSEDNIAKFKQLSEECSVNICMKKINPERYIANDCLYSVNYLTFEMYFRLFIADILNNEEKALYLDCDTVITGDILELYNEDVSEYILGAVYDYPNILRTDELKKIGIVKETYFNSGVLLMNLKEFRDNDVLKKALDYLGQNKTLKCPDQDALNTVCYGKVRFLDERWNFQWGHCIDKFIFLNEEEANKYKKVLDKFFLLHFTSPKKPWNSFACPKLGAYFWKYALYTPFQEELFESMIENAPYSDLENRLNIITNERFSNGQIGFKYIIKFFKSWMFYKIKKAGGKTKKT